MNLQVKLVETVPGREMRAWAVDAQGNHRNADLGLPEDGVVASYTTPAGRRTAEAALRRVVQERIEGAGA